MVVKKARKMSEREFYGSAEHFNTEMSYEDYIKKHAKKKKARKVNRGYFNPRAFM